MFIVLDAIDGAGKGRQRFEVSNIIKSKYNKKVRSVEFPIHDAFYEVVIHPALQEWKKMNGPSWVLSYLLDKTLYAPNIEPYVGNPDNLFIADGYFTTTIAYQSMLMDQVPLEKLLEYSIDFKIPKPDLAIYLDVDPKIAFERKDREEGHEEGLDMFEKSFDKQEELRKIFQKMSGENIYCDWESVDGNGTPKEVRDNIIDQLEKHKII